MIDTTLRKSSLGSVQHVREILIVPWQCIDTIVTLRAAQ